ncbi:UDP-3-O-(3-hydroxymyristoyl)glucosamine N-acyltransferase [Kingella negevensis]|uniref:UDP-3-O-acylglucosamine N-acyltransferase n=1 Tax=Kingella negevensis TaxID=1522312 RepID=A0A238T873_9NEIS|nr:UDP-3-O-(3-hydroxymyristoyl)glucosamine N-acyltransferase [Kingella negevensis]MDK4679342.1 UDP-3-O-(3-hydroxymyristoyl)glucosamine N-acyltransferase [Kingella negevensis]MDK4682938.1 UDP-3-O-(3-hydroxymyristoyl)glucosamine N-acyltransferase [Kingella negevensis]MDK4685165.1 UDP-3-O-(3-hydroxymyristoyl)glucosamine N-acyltransferase [Kingella negevensis]MDK4691137.1 UDP-3-O-(3-hydroxymyristoyl)glucosamine N-acyltransferase [Kingella negevensis]MDK4693715.1 UDP-3-O-(3-hydroxymyristoyl)glucosa
MFTLSQIIEKLGGEFRGDNISVHAIAPASRAQANEITFLANPKYKHEVENSTAGAVIVSQKAADLFPNRNVIVVPDPYLYFAKVARLFHPIVAPKAGVHPTAVIEPTAVVPASCEIGANVYIGANTVLGERCRILANAVIEHDCTLGNDCFIHPNVTVYFGCTIGHRVELHSGCVIGADGFGLAFSGSDWFKIPQTGGVTLGDDVEIGSNTNIDRGAMSDTVVGRGTKIDNQVQIAHNCKVGEHTVIAAQTGISGSTTIGSYCVIGGGVGTVGHIEIADKTNIGGGTNITHSIKESGQHFASIFPMQTYKEWVRNGVHINHLNEMHKRIKALEAKLAEQELNK